MTEEATTPTESAAPAPEAPSPESQAPEAPQQVQPEAQPAQPAPQAGPPSPPPDATPPQEGAPTESAGQPDDGYVVPNFITPQMRKFASDAGLSQEQFTSTIKHFGGLMQQNERGAKAKLETEGQQFINNWGDKADANLSLARRALKQNDPDGSMSAMLDKTGFGNSPVVLDFLHRLGTSMQEGGFLKGQTNRPVGQKTPAQRMFPSMHSEET